MVLFSFDFYTCISSFLKNIRNNSTIIHIKLFRSNSKVILEIETEIKRKKFGLVRYRILQKTQLHVKKEYQKLLLNVLSEYY